MDPDYQLLALCACVECIPSTRVKITSLVAELTTWDGISTLAENNGMAPLLLAHLLSNGVPLPQAIRRELQALNLRHRFAHQARSSALQEILQAFNQDEICVLVLKGAALCRLLYPEPSLRPMSDIDLLLDSADLKRAEQILNTLGYNTSSNDDPADEHRHIPPATKNISGFHISIELHHSLFDENSDGCLEQGRMDFKILSADALPFEVEPGGLIAQALGFENMLYHLCRHLVDNNDGFGPMRLIWAADIIGFATRYQKEINWELLKKCYPLVLNTLALLNLLSPLSEDLIAILPGISDRLPVGIGQDYCGWPTVSLGRGRRSSYWRIIRDTFSPPEWWLRLRYGLGCRNRTGISLFKHTFHILKLAALHLKENQ